MQAKKVEFSGQEMNESQVASKMSEFYNYVALKAGNYFLLGVGSIGWVTNNALMYERVTSGDSGWIGLLGVIFSTYAVGKATHNNHLIGQTLKGFKSAVEEAQKLPILSLPTPNSEKLSRGGKTIYFIFRIKRALEGKR